ncbi:PA2169 family four-helix-bundle protein [Tunicatimonas pelagia]|uniref:PA2169 family four-helix-bundle protein n=1 Tax=Tunicatimonas pelagia TaxID=931531 RepID=UPI0026656E8B|nr:PA2169 family four-helix-bundle protein [Tunicatimonas pelagia]WKN41038.1 PA2169 family four-helix-bundle protein [Tunicatimonas pelagia]
METQKSVVDSLNDLLKENCDAKRGYRKAAEQLDDPSLKGLFMNLSEQRDNFKKIIREEVLSLGGQPQVFRQVEGPIQDAFSQPHLLLSLNTIEKTLDGCLRLEVVSLQKLKQRLAQYEVKESTHQVLLGQLESIKVTLSDIKKLPTEREPVLDF